MPQRFIPSIASQSLGNAAHHSLPRKLALCASHGFRAIELFFADLEATAGSLPPSYPGSPPGTTFSGSTLQQEQLLAASTYISSLCQQLRLDIICLQPFMNYGGLTDRRKHAERIEEMRFWILLAQRLGTDLIQVPSSFLSGSECTNDFQIIAQDMREIADIGLQQNPVTRFCYEALAWGTQVDRWEQAWEIVKMVDRPNFGTCLDTFNLCGRVYADPASPNGVNESAEEDMQKSNRMLREELDPKKVFYVEVVDGERLDQPLDQCHPFHVDGQPSRMSWSRNARLFPFEQRGYLPVVETLKAILSSGYEGYISFEFFSRTANDESPSVPEDHANRAQESWRRLSKTMGWSQEQQQVNAGGGHEYEVAPQMKNRELFAQTRYEDTTPRSLALAAPLLQAH